MNDDIDLTRPFHLSAGPEGSTWLTINYDDYVKMDKRIEELEAEVASMKVTLAKIYSLTSTGFIHRAPSE